MGDGSLDSRMVCPTCGAEYDAGAAFCGVDGSRLRPAADPAGGVCETCGKQYQEPFDYCPDDGGRIIRPYARSASSNPVPSVDRPSVQPPGVQGAGSTAYGAAPQAGWDTGAHTGARWREQPSLGGLLSRGWELFKADYIKYIAVALLMAIPSLIEPLEVYWDLFLTVFPLPDSLMIIFALQRAKGTEPQFKDVDRVFARFWPLVLMRLAGGLLVVAGTAALVVPGIYLAVGYSLATPLLLDRGLGFWEALETSRKAVTQRWFLVAGLWLVLGAILLASVFPLILGWLVALPFALCTIVALYEAAFGVAGGPAAHHG